jgi:cell division protein FtsN
MAPPGRDTGSIDSSHLGREPDSGERLVWQASPPSRPMGRPMGTTGTAGREARPVLVQPPRSASASTAYVQVGIFRERARAERYRSDLGGLGSVEVAAMDDGSGPLYRVRIGPMTMGDARATLAELPARGVSGGTVVLE